MEIAVEGTDHSSMETPVAASMSNLDIVRSWKNPGYRRSLSVQQLHTLPEHPAGSATLTDQELKAASGLTDKVDGFGLLTTAIGCTSFTFHGWKSCGC
jgi:mersacidin/lichenicidin family type 2 lantibiotic